MYRREDNAKPLLGKQEVAFGATPAYKLGTQSAGVADPNNPNGPAVGAGPIGFSAVGNVNGSQERAQNFKNQLDMMKTVNF